MDRSHRTVTILDVARRAGVSTATVSHVLNKTRFVSDELAQRVACAVRELGYYPNQLVGSMRTKKSYTVGLVVPSIANETLGAVAERIERILFEHGYNLIICSTAYECALEERALDTLLMKQTDAIIAIPTGGCTEKLRQTAEKGVPIVLADRRIAHLQADSVLVDNVRGAYEIVQHLISLGHRNIGYIDRMTPQSHSIDQREGYLRALAQNGIPVRTRNIVEAQGYDYQAGYTAARKLLQMKDLTAIFAYYDVTALGAMRAALDLGYRVPGDISIAGYDGMPFSGFVSPRLTTVQFPAEELARRVCDFVIERLREGPGERQPENRFATITPRIVLGESTGAVRQTV